MVEFYQFLANLFVDTVAVSNFDNNCAYCAARETMSGYGARKRISLTNAEEAKDRLENLVKCPADCNIPAG
jgi:hypothetical protein